MTYLIVTETKLTTAMSHRMWILISQLGILREDCEHIALLGDEKPEGSYHKITSSQMSRVLPDFRRAVGAATAKVTIPLGGEAFRAVTGLGWSIDKAASYVLMKEDLKPIEAKADVQVGVYKTSNKSRGIVAGMPRYAMRKVGLDPVLPTGCKYIVPGVAIETVVKQRFKTVSQFRATFMNAKHLAEGKRLDDADFNFHECVPPVGTDWDGTVAYDLEVPKDSTAIEQASLSGRCGTWSFGWSHDAARAYREAMKGAKLRSAHNQQFDIPILEKHGIHVPEPNFDTMLAASLLEPDLPKGLVSVAPLYMKIRPWKHIAQTKGFTDPFYNAKDAWVERELTLILWSRLKETGMLHLFTKRIMPSVPVLMDMRDQGIRVDAKAAESYCSTMQAELSALMLRWVKDYPDVNPASPYQLKDLLYKRWGLPIKRKKGDGISTDEHSLRVLVKEYPARAEALHLLLDIRERNKLLGTFGKVLLGMDRVHPSYLPVGKDAGEGQFGKGLAATGRLACSNPNIQQQPKEVRGIYIPDSPDMYFVELDWSQAELRVAAALSGDEAMQKALKGDIHAVTQEALGCDRTRAKNVVYGSAYGAGPNKLKKVLEQAGVSVSVDECKDLQKRLASLYPAWWSWRNRIAAEAAERQHLRNPFGRVRRFPLGEQDTPAALDFIPQSVVADMGWTLYRPVWEEARRLGGRLTTVVHDSFLIQLPKGTGFDTIRALLEQEFPEVAPGFTIPADAKVGPSWGELEKA